MNSTITRDGIDALWDKEIVPALMRYVEMPNQSPLFDPDWEKNGHMARAMELARTWVEAQKITGSRMKVHTAKGRTPLLMIEVDGTGDETILMYGHLDKQPAMIGWESGLGPWKPVLRNGKLYGRGAADDGYAVFAAVAAIKAVQDQKLAHPRILVLIECSEESGSIDLPYYIDLLEEQIGTPDLVICLDSGCGDYDRLWSTTSLRGGVVGNLTVEVLSEGVHSGDASGIVPSSFRILRILLDRLEDARTGKIIPEWLHVEIPEGRIEEVRQTASVLGDAVYKHFPFVDGMTPVATDPVELLLNRTWRPMLAYTGQDGLPDLVQGGNVLRPSTSLKLSLRIPPPLDGDKARDGVKKLLESDPPYGAKVTFEDEKGGTGWEAPPPEDWLMESMERASQAFYGKGVCFTGEGGSIPFMGMLGEKFPRAQFLITGVLGPNSNAHGPNEFLHVQTGKNVTACVAQVIADFQTRAE